MNAGHPNPRLPDEPQSHEPPASVVFMEMMRRAASEQAPPEPEEAAPAEEEQAPAQGIPPARMSDDERRRQAAIEAERLRRVQRRQKQRRQKRAGMLGGVVFSWFIVVVAGGLIATILSWGTSPDSLSPQLRSEMGRITAQQNNTFGQVGMVGAEIPTAIPTPNYDIRIGIVSGHMGPENDPGAICPDRLTESEINFAVANLVWSQLRARGYEVDLLEEYDRRLEGYRANLLVSIHANDCRPYAGGASGFLVGQSETRPRDGEDARLVECVGVAYERATNLERRYTFTPDMDGYHVFNRINPSTPSVIIEMGFMLADREILTERPELLASAIITGVECFLRNEPPPPLEPEPESQTPVQEDSPPLEEVELETAG